MDVLLGAKEICKVIDYALENDEGALIGRNGTIELDMMISYKEDKLWILMKNAGIFPITDAVEWRKQSIEATQSADVLAVGWYEPLKEVEQIALKEWNCNAIRIPLRSLEPYYVQPEERWTKLLKGHSVSVISCFTKTMERQVPKLDKVWQSEIFPSDIKWKWVQTGHCELVAGSRNRWPSNIESSLDAIDWIVSEVVRQGSRFAIIGCGGIGMPVALKLKERGVIAIVVGGSIQVLFGIRGRRWKNHSIVSKFWNEHWVSPSEDETPNSADMVEGGCYW